MRTVAPWLVLLAGCAPCEGPETLLDGTWEIQTRVLEYSGQNLEAFPSGSTPANKEQVWDLDWSDSSFTVTIDQQPYAGLATWDGVECGFFSLEMSGSYLSPQLSTHDFELGGGFIVTAEALEGRMAWVEEWTAGNESGTFEAEVVVTGTPRR